MGKQKLTEEKVELIKFLLTDTRLTQKQVGLFIGTSRENITKINLGLRWSEIKTPDYNRGKLLFYKSLNYELL
jgi:hypothetical protein